MLKMYYNLPNDKSFAHVSRSCTSTLAAHALKNFWPEKYDQYKQQINSGNSPQSFMNETWANRLSPHCLVMVRNPIDRLNSLISRNSYPEEIIEAVLSACDRCMVTTREVSKTIDIVKFHHISPVCWIADNDSTFCLFPDVKKACELLDMQYYPEIHENSLQYERVNNIKEKWKTYLNDSMGLWESLSKTS
jgi:hypothetical protein